MLAVLYLNWLEEITSDMTDVQSLIAFTLF